MVKSMFYENQVNRFVIGGLLFDLSWHLLALMAIAGTQDPSASKTVQVHSWSPLLNAQNTVG